MLCYLIFYFLPIGTRVLYNCIYFHSISLNSISLLHSNFYLFISYLIFILITINNSIIINNNNNNNNFLFSLTSVDQSKCTRKEFVLLSFQWCFISLLVLEVLWMIVSFHFPEQGRWRWSFQTIPVIVQLGRFIYSYIHTVCWIFKRTSS